MIRPRRTAEDLAGRAEHDLVGIIRMPESSVSPVTAIVRRIAWAVVALFAAVLLVYLDRDGYRDVNEDGISFLDAVYYATVSLSTTGYGDITPASDSARLLNILVITPLRVLFLIVLVGTTLAVLTERSRQAFKIQRWRSNVRDHVVVVGYGTKGRSAVSAVLSDGVEPSRIVVVDTDQAMLDAASSLGLVTVHGSGTRSDVLRVAGVPRAKSVVVAASRDDSAVLITLTAREMSPNAQIVAAVRETENVHLLRQSGANQVVVSSETAGRLLGMATHTPTVVDMVEDLITPDEGLAIAEREVEDSEVGGSPRHLPDIVLGLVRAGKLYRVDSSEADAIEHGDRLLYIRKVTPAED
ncbi:NAD-binding protein of Kef-type K+ transporter [Actinokineospora globicatena]|uniref:NAD-binding protein of Kef-type K+ transporter n=1 Tax=Actinokineospora globicatena TaxID=103729 RepID=A0A9W6V7B6_9PSEU|nr:NAD-binding protein of Kef-type K+ transporter [Actinokineospora globicatena]GLW88100.1 NAD-binding protein of Kef-type K+ transporter [Actinokineospora globicatena]GLW92585.1 NAD-binding protein of Kef-type K+ transporter [Actinokineospora globicatena]